MSETTYLSDTPLAQRGRASIDFFAHLSRSVMKLGPTLEAEVAATGLSADALPDDLDDRLAFAEPLARQSPAFRVQQLAGEWHSQQHGPVSVEAFEAIAPALLPKLQALDEGPATLEAEPGFQPPAFWEGIDFHRTRGGWDGHPYMGFVHGEIVHRKMIDAIFPGGIFKQRLRVAGEAPRARYDSILDMGCSTGHFTLALAETYPDAAITGCDLSLRTLEHARRVANERGYPWRLLQRCATDTGLAADSFDLVASYILLHELPATAIRATFAEAYRVLAPGGDMIMSDVTRYAELDKLATWKADRGARFGGEPHWRESASLDLGAVAREAGFVDVEAGGLDGAPYPYVVRGRKPA